MFFEAASTPMDGVSQRAIFIRVVSDVWAETVSMG